MSAKKANTSDRKALGYPFRRSTIKAIIDEAKANHDAISVRHIQPRAYCVAKPAICCAVFAVQPCDCEPQAISASVSVQNETASQAEVGKWYAVVYCVRRTGVQENRIIFALNADVEARRP